MALTNKRIIDLPERATLNSDDYTVVDGSNGGTGKYKLLNMQESVNDLSQTVTDHGTRLTTAEQNIETNTADITDLKEDLSQKAPVIINASDDAEVVTFSDGAEDMPMKSVVLKLVPHQEGSGEPSPDNVRPISGYTSVTVYQNTSQSTTGATAYPITFPQAVYGGELDAVSGVLKVTHGYFVFDGSNDEDWEQSGDNRMRASISGSYAEGYTRIAVTANRGVFGTGSAVGTIFLSNRSLYYYQPTDITTVSAFRSWLASNNLQVVYPLATPIEITLDKTTIKTLLGTNTIWMSADGTIQCDYPADTKMYIDALTAPDDDMIADTNIANGKYFTVNNRLYISTTAIAQGEAIVVGTNCTQTDLATALNAINA